MPGRPLATCVIALACLVAGCGATARPPSNPDRMPSETLGRQDPGADTSDHPVLHRTEAHEGGVLSGVFGGCGSHAEHRSGRETFIGCGGCTVRDPAAASNALVVLVVFVVTRGRRRGNSPSA